MGAIINEFVLSCWVFEGFLADADGLSPGLKTDFSPRQHQENSKDYPNTRRPCAGWRDRCGGRECCYIRRLGIQTSTLHLLQPVTAARTDHVENAARCRAASLIDTADTLDDMGGRRAGLKPYPIRAINLFCTFLQQHIGKPAGLSV